MKSLKRFNPLAPTKIKRDHLKVIIDLNDSLRRKYTLVITTKSGKISGYVDDMNPDSGKVTIISSSTKIELNTEDILLTD